MVYVYALNIKETKKNCIYLTRMPAWRWNWQAAVTARSSRVEFVAMVVIIGVG